MLPKKYLQHFALFVEAMYILLGDNISREDLEVAENLLDGFYKNFEQFYGILTCNSCFFFHQDNKLYIYMWFIIQTDYKK